MIDGVNTRIKPMSTIRGGDWGGQYNGNCQNESVKVRVPRVRRDASDSVHSRELGIPCGLRREIASGVGKFSRK